MKPRLSEREIQKKKHKYHELFKPYSYYYLQAYASKNSSE
jgi:hypothetical protein